MTVAPAPVHHAPRRLLYGLLGLAALLIAAGVALLVQQIVFEKSSPPAGRADLQVILDRLDAEDEATFLRAAMNGTLFEKQLWLDIYGTPVNKTCGSLTYFGEGSGDGYHSYVAYDTTGSRIAVLLLNKDRVGGASAVRRLYCAA